MHAEEWEEVKEIVDRALKLPEEDRSAYLASIEDEIIRQSAEGLLKVSPTEAEAFDRVRFFPTGRDIPYAPGDTVGPYTILNAVERGGMGAVFEARDGRNERVVALKILPPSALPFSRNEDKAQARLTHRYIAALYESGTTPEGFRYVAMEYVEGVPINAFAAKHCPTVRSRLKLFRKVCEAVEYAHQKLVVHRDLKPDNILVTQGGDPKLLDFGIAKILPPDLALATLTRSAERPFTLAYASPEQLGGDYTDTRTDIYSLGVLLCLLLTGRLPYRTDSHELPQGHTEGAVRPSLARRRAVRPSWQGNPRQLRRLLEGELDAIILRALRKKPDERYRSVAELGEDVRRYLDHEPVVARAIAEVSGQKVHRTASVWHRLCRRGARPPPRLYRESPLLQPAGAYQRDRARLEAQRAELPPDSSSTCSGCQTLGRWPERRPAPGRCWTTLHEGSKRCHPRSLAPGTSPLSRENQSQSRHVCPAADALLIPALLEKQNTVRGTGALIAETLADLARIRYHEARYTEAEEYAKKAIAIQGANLDTRTLLGRIAFARGDYLGAEALFRLAVAGTKHFYDADSLRFASATHDLRLRPPCSGTIRRSRAPLRTDALDPPSAPRRRQLCHPQVLHNLACLAADRGEFDKAEAEFMTVRLGYHHLSDPNFPALPTLSHNRGSTFASAGNLPEADGLLFDSLAGYRFLYPDDHPNVGRALAAVGRLLDAQGRLPAAEQYYRDALARLTRSLGKDHPDTLSAENNLAALRAEEGDSHEAEASGGTSYGVPRDTPSGAAS